MSQKKDNLVTQKAFAEEIGISPSAVNQLVRKGKIPLVNGKIPLKEGLAAYKFVGQNGTNQTTDDMVNTNNIGQAIQKAELVDKNYRAKMRQLDYEERKGKLIDVEQVKQDAEKVAALLRTTLLSMPSRLALQLEGKEAAEIQALLEHEINQVLTKLHETKF